MKTDKAIHEVFEYFEGKEIRWHDFSEVGMDEPYYDYYYAEDCLYVIRDRVRQTYWFVEASCPRMAMEAYREEMAVGTGLGDE